jgi:hypothetical protein
MNPATLLAVLLAFAPAPVPADALHVHDMAMLTDHEARALQGRRLLYRVELDGEPERRGDAVCYDGAGPDPAYRSLWLRPDAGLACELAAKGSGVLLVEATLRRIVHPPIRGADGSNLPGLVEYRLTRTVVVGVTERPRLAK